VRVGGLNSPVLLHTLNLTGSGGDWIRTLGGDVNESCDCVRVRMECRMQPINRQPMNWGQMGGIDGWRGDCGAIVPLTGLGTGAGSKGSICVTAAAPELVPPSHRSH
jgi:hypothetical protein